MYDKARFYMTKRSLQWLQFLIGVQKFVSYRKEHEVSFGGKKPTKQLAPVWSVTAGGRSKQIQGNIVAIVRYKSCKTSRYWRCVY